MGDAATFTLQEALAAQQALRTSLGLSPELFPVEAFVGMISDEIEASRTAGRDDEAIVALIRTTTGKVVSVEDLRAFYVAPEGRAGHGDGR